VPYNDGGASLVSNLTSTEVTVHIGGNFNPEIPVGAEAIWPEEDEREAALKVRPLRFIVILAPILMVTLTLQAIESLQRAARARWARRRLEAARSHPGREGETKVTSYACLHGIGKSTMISDPNPNWASRWRR